MRHLTRVHGVCIGFMHEQYVDTNIAMSYIPTSQMAADIYTKEFTDSEKWNVLCRQIGLYTKKALEVGDLLSLFISQHELRSEKRGEHAIYEATAVTSPLPDELFGLRSALGVHANDDGSQHAIVKEPKFYRLPKNNDKLNRRSTWIKRNNEWHQVEDGIEWSEFPNKKLEEWTEKAVFYFWEQAPDEGVNKACPVLQDVFPGPRYIPRMPLRDVLGDPTEEIFDQTLRCVMIGHQQVGFECTECDGGIPFWCCRDCETMLRDRRTAESTLCD